jgi:putative hydrolase of the HAD superfamily
MADLDLTAFRALSFDCYGTLIDWETGIAAVLRPWADEQGLGATGEELLLAYADGEATAEREAPSALYPEVLAMAFRATGERLGAPVSDAWAARLGDSVPDWPAFPDSADALARLARRYKLIILSTVHRAGFAGSNERLRGDFAAIITAEDVGAYKPAENHFRALDAPLPGLGVEFLRGKKPVGSGTTDAAGQTSVSVSPKRTSRYRARYGGSGALSSYLSRSKRVKVTK